MAPDLSHSPSGPFIDRFLNGLPGELRGSFTPDQLLAVQRAFGMRYAPRHTVDLRRSIRLPGAAFYLVLLIGPARPADAAPGRALLPAGLAAALAGLSLLLLR